MKKNYYEILAVIVLVIFSYFFINMKKNKELDDFDIVDGLVVNFHYNNYSYCLDYEYYVSKQKYKNSICGMSKFYCKDSILGCVGGVFKVKYSKNKPSISEIDLEGYNRFKPYIP